MVLKFLNSGRKVKLKYLAELVKSKKALYIQHFLYANKIIYLTQKNGHVYLFFFFEILTFEICLLTYASPVI